MKFQIVQVEKGLINPAFTAANGRWYIRANGIGGNFLHSDGIVKRGAVDNGKPSGWFKTRELARQAVRHYKDIANEMEAEDPIL